MGGWVGREEGPHRQHRREQQGKHTQEKPGQQDERKGPQNRHLVGREKDTEARKRWCAAESRPPPPLRMNVCSLRSDRQGVSKVLSGGMEEV